MWRLFHRSLALFIGLGVVPILIIAIALTLPTPLQIEQFKILTGILLIVSTISTLCLAGLVVTILKKPLQQLQKAQNEIKRGNLSYRLPAEGSVEMQNLFQGFNEMASSIADAAEQERQHAAERSLTKIASQVVHDIRSPLSSLNVVAHYFSVQKNSDPNYPEILQILKLSIDRIKSIAEELLSKRKDHAHQSPTLLHDAIDDLITEFKARKHEHLDFFIDYHQPAIPVPASKIEIQRAVGNILTNAIEAMQAVGKISITTQESDCGVKIYIKDNGPGMTADVLHKVLKGGFTHGKVDGNGVGMTVVREIIEKHRGTLDGESKPGFGTTFILDLPLYDATS